MYIAFVSILNLHMYMLLRDERTIEPIVGGCLALANPAAKELSQIIILTSKHG